MYKSEVYKTWILVLQLGISMMVPIFLLVVIAYIVDKKFGFNFMLIAVIIGVIAGIRNVYVILHNYINTMSKPKESELTKKHLNNGD